MSVNIVLERSIGGHFAPSTLTNPLLRTWCLSIEEHFYLIVPAVLIVVWFVARGKRGRGHRRAIAVLAAMGGASLFLVFAVSRGLSFVGVVGDPQAFTFYFSFTRAWEFIAGAILALIGNRWAVSGFAAKVPVVAGLFAILVASLTITESGVPNAWALVPVAGTVLVIAGGANAVSTRVNPLTSSAAAWLGDRSYSWYVWHWPVLVFSVDAIGVSLSVSTAAAALSLGPAIASFRWIEQPLRSAPWLSVGQSFALMGVCVGATLALSFAVVRATAIG